MSHITCEQISQQGSLCQVEMTEQRVLYDTYKGTGQVRGRGVHQPDARTSHKQGYYYVQCECCALGFRQLYKDNKPYNGFHDMIFPRCHKCRQGCSILNRKAQHREDNT